MKALEILNKLKNQTLTCTLMDIENAIVEIKALQQPKSCAKCKAFKLDDEHNDGFGQCFWGIHFPNGKNLSYHEGTYLYCSDFEAKEQ